MECFLFGVAVKCTWGHISHPFWDMLPFDTKSILGLPWVLEDHILIKAFQGSRTSVTWRALLGALICANIRIPHL